MSTPATTPDAASRPVCDWAPDPDGDPDLLPGTFGGHDPVAAIAATGGPT